MTIARYGIDDAPMFVIDQSRCIGCEACVQACQECGTHRGRSLIHLERIERRTTHADGADGVHALRGPDVRPGVPGRRDQADRARHRAVGAQAALHRLLELRARLPVRRAEVRRRVRPDDEVRHVPRPHVRRAQADVRVGVPERGAVVRHDRGVRRTRRGSLLRDFLFGRQEVRTKVYTVVDDLAAGPIDVLGPARTTLARRPVRPGGGDVSVTDDGDPADAAVARDFPYEAAAEDEVTRREFARFLVLGAGAMAAGNVGLAAWTQLRSINTGSSRGRSWPSTTSPVGATYLFRYPRRRPGDAAAPGRPEVVGVQPEVHASRLRRLLPGRRGPVALPVPRGQLRHPHRRGHLRPADATARTHRRRGPRRRHDLGAGRPE